MSRVRAAFAAALVLSGLALTAPAHAEDNATIVGTPCNARIDDVNGERFVSVIGTPVFVGVVDGPQPGPANPTTAGCLIYVNGEEVGRGYSPPGIGIAAPPPYKVKIESQFATQMTSIIWAKLPDGTWIHRVAQITLQTGG